MKAKHIALGGVLAGLTIIFLYASAILKTNTLALLTLSSFMVAIGLMRGSFKTACTIYVSSSLLSFFLIPLNIALLYSLFFGLYALIKYFIERIRRLPIEIFLKLAFFNSIVALIVFLMQNLLGYTLFYNFESFISKYISLNMPYIRFIVIAILLQLGFLAYDYGLTLLIDYYRKYASRF